MSAPFKAQPRAVAGLIERLDLLGVKLPDNLAGAVTLLEDATDGTLTREAGQLPNPGALLGMSRADLLEVIRADASLHVAQDRIPHSVWQVAEAAARAAAEAVQRHADEILAQLAPRFTEAADAVHHARAAGINPGMSAADVIALGNPDAIAAWSALAAAVETLDELAFARLAMTDMAGVAPSADPFGPVQYGAAFSPDAPLWHSASGPESSLDRWLRLSGGKPLRLLSTAQTEAAARKHRSAPPPPLVSFADANGSADERADMFAHH